MPPPTSTDRQKLLLQQEIAKLSGQISRHASSSRPIHHPYSSGRVSLRGLSGRGRGRGRTPHRSLDLRHNIDNSTSSSGSIPERKEQADGWIRSTSSVGNVSLMSTETRDKLNTRRRQRERERPSTSGQRVEIDGVVYQFDEGGKRLTRVDDAMPTHGGHPAMRKTLRYGGYKFKRNTRGDLVQSRNKSDMPCRFYTKTGESNSENRTNKIRLLSKGRCNRALDCPYMHDSGRLAVCPRYLRGSCPHGSEMCPLSHVPSAHNTPSCVHFQATSACRNGPKCLYPHVRVGNDAPVCEAFARGGWCGMAPGTCAHLHAWECQEYREKGTCSKDGKCGLRHVLRAENLKSAVPSSAPGSFEGNTDFVNFDAGSPPPISDADMDSDGDSDLSASESSDSDSDAEEALAVVA